MKAIVVTKSGSPDVLQLKEVEKPVPKDGEVLVKVRAATVTQGDVLLRKASILFGLVARMFGARRKKIPGHEFAGDVEAVGAGVKRFRAGDSVFGTTTDLPFGANAEYVCVPETGEQVVLAAKPAAMTYEEAAAVPIGGLTALFFLRKGQIASGQNVLIYGASGSVGTYAVQLAAALGATVTGVSNAATLDLVRSLGATSVLDYTKENFAEQDARYDIVFDAVGKAADADCENVLTPQGAYVSVRHGVAKHSTEELLFLTDLIEAKKLRAVIDRRYPLEQTAEAHRYVESGKKIGNVVITVVPDA